MIARRVPEDAIQRSVVRHYERFRLPNTYLASVPNESPRSKAYLGRLIGMGLRPGFPDLICFGPRRGLIRFLELKADDGTLTENQCEMHERLESLGLEVATAWGADAPIILLEEWRIVRPVRRLFTFPGRIQWWTRGEERMVA